VWALEEKFLGLDLDLIWKKLELMGEYGYYL